MLSSANLGLAYATSIDNHTPSSVAVFVAFTTTVGLRYGFNHAPRHWIAAGRLAGRAPRLDLGVIPIVPLLLSFVADWLSQVRYRAGFALFLVLMLVAQFHADAALTNPWEVSSWDRWLNS